MYKLVICDLDGTITGRDMVFPKEAYGFSQVMAKKGILFTIATGRSENSISHMIKNLKIEIPYVVSNGATIMQKQIAIERMQISVQLLSDVVSEAEKRDLPICITSEGTDYLTRKTNWFLREEEKLKINYHLLRGDGWKNGAVEKLLIVDEKRSGGIDQLECMLRNISGCIYYRYGNHAIECMHKMANKGYGVKRLNEILGIKAEETLVIGDDPNDLPMASFAGASAAVSNASEILKKEVSYVCQRSSFDGVVEAIERFCR